MTLDTLAEYLSFFITPETTERDLKKLIQTHPSFSAVFHFTFDKKKLPLGYSKYPFVKDYFKEAGVTSLNGADTQSSIIWTPRLFLYADFFQRGYSFWGHNELREKDQSLLLSSFHIRYLFQSFPSSHEKNLLIEATRKAADQLFRLANFNFDEFEKMRQTNLSFYTHLHLPSSEQDFYSGGIHSLRKRSTDQIILDLYKQASDKLK